jgi:hypothetical protein
MPSAELLVLITGRPVPCEDVSIRIRDGVETNG